MAFVFGFNKQKVLSAAEKFVQQGKLQNAIAEYEKIRKHDEKDLTVANTIGDLYARLGDVPKAIECFRAVGDAYAAQGFTVKGIAMYKKITKLQPSMDGSLKLAELYTQQGLFNDARAQYLQVAEEFMKSGDLEQAVRLFQKVLEMDPENVPMRVKLAEVYVKLGKKKEAWEIFSAAAESLRARGSLAAAEDILQRMLVLDPGNSYVLLMRGKAALDSDDPRAAVQYLERAADIDSHPDGLRDLLKAYLESGNLAKCSPLAEKLLTVHNDPEGLFLLAEGAARLGHYNQALEVYSAHAERLLATDSTKLLGNLHALIAPVQDDAGALERLLELLKKSGESTHVNEVAELLAHASVKNGSLERARDLYQMLGANEPQNAVHAQNYQQVMERMLGPSRPAVAEITAEEGALIVEELEATAPMTDQLYPDQVAIAIRAAVTDADLFLSYNLPEKALVPLLGALPQAPRDVRLNQRLAALHTRFQRFAEAAVCCRTLESVFHDAGYPDEAVRYGELAARYEQNTGAAVAGDVAPMAAAPVPALAHVAEPEMPGHPEFSVEEGAAHASGDTPDDVSSEWERAIAADDNAPMEQEQPVRAQRDPESDLEIAETAEEIRFYLEHFMTDQARTAFERLETLTHDAAVLDPLRTAIESGAKLPEEPEAEIAEINADDPATLEVELKTSYAEETATAPGLLSGYDHPQHDDTVPAHAPEQPEPAYLQDSHSGLTHPEPASAEPVLAQTAHAAPDELTALVADLESSLGDTYPSPTSVGAPPAAAPALGKSPWEQPSAAESSTVAMPGWGGATSAQLPAIPSPEPKPEPVAGAASAPEVGPMSAPIAIGAAAAAAPAMMSYSPAPVRPLGADAQAMHPAGSVDLSEIFGELKHELEEDVPSTDEDPETHYNLGVAFREMGLLDEAIAELQKVCTAIDRGLPFGQIVQTYTWLAQCFLDKGVPEAAIRWYDKALDIPGLDSQARVAINYELGSACETAQDKPGALRHFTYVYGANIDYRDVAERIQALKS
ncbi:MAG: tetratricopeptide repeat protein [Terriglobales bacterium]